MQPALHQDLADELWEADRSAAPVAPLTTRHDGLDIEDAYAIQSINIERRVAAGQKVIVRKVGLTSKPMQELLGVDEPVLPELVPVSKTSMAPSYPELERDFGRISTIAYAEEETFRQTLRAGTTIFDQFARSARRDEVLAQAPAAEDGRFRVARILDEEA